MAAGKATAKGLNPQRITPEDVVAVMRLAEDVATMMADRVKTVLSSVQAGLESIQQMDAQVARLHGGQAPTEAFRASVDERELLVADADELMARMAALGILNLPVGHQEGSMATAEPAAPEADVPGASAQAVDAGEAQVAAGDGAAQQMGIGRVVAEAVR